MRCAALLQPREIVVDHVEIARIAVAVATGEGAGERFSSIDRWPKQWRPSITWMQPRRTSSLGA
jgi:hypothetical protein